MAIQTLTSTVFANFQPKANVTGDITVSGQYNSGTTDVSVGDFVWLAKIPHGAKIVSFTVDHSNGETSLGLDYGMVTGGSIAGGGIDISQFVSDGTIATVIRSTLLPASGATNVVSVSDNSGVRYGIFGCSAIGGTGTDSTIINFSITYRCDE